jgi:hypothetical protein
MNGNTTKTKALCMSRPRLRLVLSLLAAGLLLTGCTTARQRDDPANLLGNLRFRSEETFDFFHAVYRSGNLYRNFRPVMVVDTIYEDQRYRELFLRTLREQFLIPQEAVARMRGEQAEAYRNRMDFLLFVYGGTNERVDLHKAESRWKVFLRDDDGQLIAPTRLERVGEKNTVFTFLEQYFVGLDRWSEVVSVSFPKLDKALLGQEPGPHPVQLIVTGIPGTVTLTWEDPSLFYAAPREDAETPLPEEARGAKKEG